jgi:hypothetical protein
MVKYLVAQNKAYHNTNAVSMIADKARMGNVDNLFAAVMDVETGMSSWMPPQAIPSSSSLVRCSVLCVSALFFVVSGLGSWCLCSRVGHELVVRKMGSSRVGHETGPIWSRVG